MNSGSKLESVDIAFSNVSGVVIPAERFNHLALEGVQDFYYFSPKNGSDLFKIADRISIELSPEANDPKFFYGADEGEPDVFERIDGPYPDIAYVTLNYADGTSVEYATNWCNDNGSYNTYQTSELVEGALKIKIAPES